MKLFKICYFLGMVGFGMSLPAHDRESMESKAFIEQMMKQDEAIREQLKRDKEIIAQGKRQNAMMLNDINNRIRGFLEELDN